MAQVSVPASSPPQTKSIDVGSMFLIDLIVNDELDLGEQQEQQQHRQQQQQHHHHHHKEQQQQQLLYQQPHQQQHPRDTKLHDTSNRDCEPFNYNPRPQHPSAARSKYGSNAQSMFSSSTSNNSNNLDRRAKSSSAASSSSTSSSSTAAALSSSSSSAASSASSSATNSYCNASLSAASSASSTASSTSESKPIHNLNTITSNNKYYYDYNSHHRYETNPRASDGWLDRFMVDRASAMEPTDDEFLNQEYNDNHHNHYPVDEFDDDQLRAEDNPMKLFESIQALARSLHKDREIFGSLPPKRMLESPIRSLAFS